MNWIKRVSQIWQRRPLSYFLYKSFFLCDTPSPPLSPLSNWCYIPPLKGRIYIGKGLPISSILIAKHCKLDFNTAHLQLDSYKLDFNTNTFTAGLQQAWFQYENIYSWTPTYLISIWSHLQLDCYKLDINRDTFTAGLLQTWFQYRHIYSWTPTSLNSIRTHLQLDCNKLDFNRDTFTAGLLQSWFQYWHIYSSTATNRN